MNNDYVQDYLEHHGIKGQKWGVINKKDILNANKKVKSKKDDINDTINEKTSSKFKTQKGKERTYKVLNTIGAIAAAPLLLTANVAVKGAKPFSKKAKEIDKADRKIRKEDKKDSKNYLYNKHIVNKIPYGKQAVSRFGLKIK